ncbi:MAG: threonine synthase [Gaiellaceae bacterium]
MTHAPAAALSCVRCGAQYELDEVRFGCPVCEATVPANLEVVYSGAVVPEAGEAGAAHGMWRWAAGLPVAAEEAVTLGEGDTPLVELPRLAAELGVPGLLAKDETRNPTWSFKDRLASAAVSWARSRGRPGIAVSSSGNAGASVAAYAARAGLPCVVFTTRAFPGTMQRFMRSFGAMVVAVPEAPDRWTLNRAVAEHWGWLPVSNVADPPVGSHPAGVEGCKTIAYEIAESLAWHAPDAVVVPVAYGDSLSGLYRGFGELAAAGRIDRVPRLVAVEAYPSLSETLATGAAGPVRVDGSGSLAYSVATPRGTFQALRAIRESNGTAVAVSNEEALRAQRELREREGLLVELSAAMPLAGVRKLLGRGVLEAGARVVLLITSSGLKDLEVTDVGGELPLTEPTLDALARLLEASYGYAA